MLDFQYCVINTIKCETWKIKRFNHLQSQSMSFLALLFAYDRNKRIILSE